MKNIKVADPLLMQNIKYALDDTADYYKLILKDIKPYIDDIIYLVEGENADYWSKSQKKLISVTELKSLRDKIIQESYGEK